MEEAAKFEGARDALEAVALKLPKDEPVPYRLDLQRLNEGHVVARVWATEEDEFDVVQASAE